LPPHRRHLPHRGLSAAPPLVGHPPGPGRPLRTAGPWPVRRTAVAAPANNSLAPSGAGWWTVAMEMHTTSTPAPTSRRASTLGTTASLLRPGGAVTASAASDGGRALVVLAAGAR